MLLKQPKPLSAAIALYWLSPYTASWQCKLLCIMHYEGESVINYCKYGPLMLNEISKYDKNVTRSCVSMEASYPRPEHAGAVVCKY